MYMFSIVNAKVLNTSIYDVKENNNITPGSGMADGVYWDGDCWCVCSVIFFHGC